MPIAAMLFYQQNDPKCEAVMDILEELGIPTVTTDVYDDVNLSLVEQWNICCVPTVIFSPSYHVYLPEAISKEAFEKEISYSKKF